jgi:hypothetical protein
MKAHKSFSRNNMLPANKVRIIVALHQMSRYPFLYRSLLEMIDIQQQLAFRPVTVFASRSAFHRKRDGLPSERCKIHFMISRMKAGLTVASILGGPGGAGPTQY